MHNQNSTLGLVLAKCIIISPKKELAHANQSLVILVGSSTENDSCIKLSLADLTKLAKQFLISLSEREVRIWMVKAKGQMYR